VLNKIAVASFKHYGPYIVLIFTTVLNGSLSFGTQRTLVVVIQHI
jgi:hypothetical protein